MVSPLGEAVLTFCAVTTALTLTSIQAQLKSIRERLGEETADGEDDPPHKGAYMGAMRRTK